MRFPHFCLALTFDHNIYKFHRGPQLARHVKFNLKYYNDSYSHTCNSIRLLHALIPMHNHMHNCMTTRSHSNKKSFIWRAEPFACHEFINFNCQKIDIIYTQSHNIKLPGKNPLYEGMKQKQTNSEQ